MKRWRFYFLLLSPVACGLGYGAYTLTQPSGGPPAKESLCEACPKKRFSPGNCQNLHKGEPVPLNRGPEVVDGFRGQVHPLLHGRTDLELIAHWVADARSAGVKKHLDQGPHFFLDMRPADERRRYT